MHKDFYASGFLYNPYSNEFLLQTSSTDTSSEWSLLGALGTTSQKAEEIFQNTIYELLQLKLTLGKIHPVYMYFDDKLGKDHYIFYAEVRSQKDFQSLKEKLFSWFTQKQILKLPKTQQTGQDIIVGQRVIDARERKRIGLHTFE